ncbi:MULTISPECIES: hypothetical protein [unclassified Streptomyces]|uniref:hypothetical protein n=1 Tax=unclassified Streptomyces TaxID=2593676 RepID=UPI003669A3A4
MTRSPATHTRAPARLAVNTSAAGAVALALIALRIGGHFALNALGLAVTSTLGHVLFALVMAAATIGLLAYSQAAALRALTTTAATPHSTGTHASAV